MNPDIGSVINDPQGPVHAGSGAQNVAYYHFYLAGDHLAVRRARRGTLAPDQEYLRWLMRRFEPAAGYEQAVSKLARYHVVLLAGAAGIGRHSAALMLLSHWRHRDGELVRLADDTDAEHEGDQQGAGPSPPPLLDAADIEQHSMLLLDLSARSRADVVRLSRELPPFRSRLEHRQARLVVILPPDVGTVAAGMSEFTPELDFLTAELGRPDTTRALGLHLRASGVPFDPADLVAPDVHKLLSSGAVTRIARLVSLIQREAVIGPDGGFAQWRDIAVRRLAAEIEPVHLPGWISEGPSGERRALMLAAAMLEGAPADAVFCATQALLATMAHPPTDLPELDRDDLAKRITDLEWVELDADERVLFREARMARAVRNHFWTHRPDLRDKYGQWVDQAMRLDCLPASDRQALALRFGEQSLRKDRPEELTRWAWQWSAQEPVLRACAANLLVLGVNDSQHGSLVRRKILEWSKEPELPAKTHALLAQLCGEIMAASHPAQALVRLHHLARRELRKEEESTAVAPPRPATAALVELTSERGRLLRRMLFRLAQGPARHGQTADRRLFVLVAEPGRLLTTRNRARALLAERDVREQVAAGWHMLLAEADGHGDTWEPPIHRWLGAATGADHTHRVWLLQALVSGAARGPGVVEQVFRVARIWAYSAGDGEPRDRRLMVLDQLLETIDRATVPEEAVL